MSDVPVPDSRTEFVDRNGKPTRAFYVFLHSLYKQAGGGQVTDVDLEAVTFLARGTPAPAPVGPDAVAAMARAPIQQTPDLSPLTFRQSNTETQQIKDRLAVAELTAYSTRTPLPASPGVQLRVYTVSTLPIAGQMGRLAAVSDATAPTYLGALTGGGTVKTPVFDNGTSWVSF